MGIPAGYPGDFGWHAFGTRRDEFNLTEAGIEQFVQRHAHLRQSVDVFRATLAERVEEVLRDHPDYREFQANQGVHRVSRAELVRRASKQDDPKELRLIDVLVDPAEIIGPRQFVADFGHLYAARVVYQGKLTGTFAEDVRLGKYDVSEGVVCKGGSSGADVWMVKIKTYAYMERLKQAFWDQWEAYWE